MCINNLSGAPFTRFSHRLESLLINIKCKIRSHKHVDCQNLTLKYEWNLYKNNKQVLPIL